VWSGRSGFPPSPDTGEVDAPEAPETRLQLAFRPSDSDDGFAFGQDRSLQQAAMPLFRQPCFGIDARHHGGAELFYCSLNRFAATFLEGAVQ
jgi:hypothetical protein